MCGGREVMIGFENQLKGRTRECEEAALSSIHKKKMPVALHQLLFFDIDLRVVSSLFQVLSKRRQYRERVVECQESICRM